MEPGAETKQESKAESSSRQESTQEPGPAQGHNPWPPGQAFPGDQNEAQLWASEAKPTKGYIAKEASFRSFLNLERV